MSCAEQNPSPVHQVPLLKLLDFSLRLSVVPLGAVSFWLAFSSHQESSIYGKIEFSKFTCLKYMVCTSAISAAYALAAAACSWLWFECLLTKAWAFFISDQIIAYLMLTSGAAVLEVLYLAYNGDQRVSWSEACSFYGNFCSRLKLSLVLHALALCCFFLLSVISAYRAFSIFGPPYAPSKEEGEERN